MDLINFIEWEIVNFNRNCTSHRLKLGTFPPNEVGRVAQNVRKGEGRKERKDREGQSR